MISVCPKESRCKGESSLFLFCVHCTDTTSHVAMSSHCTQPLGRLQRTRWLLAEVAQCVSSQQEVVCILLPGRMWRQGDDYLVSLHHAFVCFVIAILTVLSRPLVLYRLSFASFCQSPTQQQGALTLCHE